MVRTFEHLPLCRYNNSGIKNLGILNVVSLERKFMGGLFSYVGGSESLKLQSII